MRGLARLSLSAVFVGANFAASFLIVVLITRQADPVAREVFFTFQAIFFVCVLLASQTSILQTYRGRSDCRAELVTEAGIFTTSFLVLLLFVGDKAGTEELMAYAVATVASARAAATMAALQFVMRHPAESLVPVAAALSRCATAFGLMSFGPAVAFLGAALAHLSVGYAARWALARKRHAAAPDATLTRQHGGHWEMFAFTAATAVAFQWDRLLLSTRDLGDLVVMSGVVLTWVLPPLSLIFATVFRASAGEIFQRELPKDQAWHIFLRQGGLFTALGLAWLGVLWFAWVPLNAFAFPFADAPGWLATLLGTALIFDRLGNLAALIRGGRFARRALTKAGIVGAALLLAAVVLSTGAYENPIAVLFGIYALQSTAWLASALLALVWRGSAEEGACRQGARPRSD